MASHRTPKGDYYGRSASARIALLLICACFVCGCGRAPSIGDDKEAFKAVDALYTAVSLRDAKLVDQCQGQLKALREAGKLPDAAASSLDAMIAEAKGGAWEPAQERLARFMEGQRR